MRLVKTLVSIACIAAVVAGCSSKPADPLNENVNPPPPPAQAAPSGGGK